MKYAFVLLVGQNNLNDFFLTAAGTGEIMMLGCSPPSFTAHAGAAGLTVLAHEAAVLVQ